MPKGSQEMVAAAIRTIFAQPDAEAVAEQLTSIADKLGAPVPAVEPMLLDAAPDITAFAAFPQRTGGRSGPPTRSSGSTARSSVAPTSSASSPTTPPSCAWSAAVLIETHDEWQVIERRYFSEGSIAASTPSTEQPTLEITQEVAATELDRGDGRTRPTAKPNTRPAVAPAATFASIFHRKNALSSPMNKPAPGWIGLIRVVGDNRDEATRSGLDDVLWPIRVEPPKPNETLLVWPKLCLTAE